MDLILLDPQIRILPADAKHFLKNVYAMCIRDSLLDGKSVSDTPLYDLAAMVGSVFQNHKMCIRDRA